MNRESELILLYSTETMFKDYPDLLTPKMIQEILNISRSTYFRMLKSGEIRSIKLSFSNKRLFPKQALVNYLNTQDQF